MPADIFDVKIMNKVIPKYRYNFGTRNVNVMLLHIINLQFFL